MEVPAGVSARELYQNLLHNFGFSFGLWQRTDLQYYGEVVHVYMGDNQRLVFDQILPSASGVQRLKFLYIYLDAQNQVVTENLNRLTAGGSTRVIRRNEDGQITMEIEVDHSHPEETETVEYSGYMAELRSFNTNQHPELFMEFAESKNKRRRQFSFQPLLTETWLEKYHGDFSSWSSLLANIRPGVFVAEYGSHGLEMIHFRDGQGVKITGDPNVPYNEVTFRVTSKDRVDFPLEIQSDMDELIKATKDFTRYLVADEKVTQWDDQENPSN